MAVLSRLWAGPIRLAAFFAVGLSLVWASSALAQGTFVIDFNSGTDSMGNAQGDLVFESPSGFVVTFTDDDSTGGFGGDANGVHINTIGYGNNKAGSGTDYVLGAFNAPDGALNFHSSGIVATFSEGADSVSVLDTDDDSTTKILFAYDQNGALIGQTAPGSQSVFTLSTANTGGTAIWGVEFDTQSGTAGGASDGTYFTIDDFVVNFGGLNTIDIDFNSGVDNLGKDQGSLQFEGPDGFIVYITDDDSNGGFGGDADGVHITNINYGNIKVGSSTDFVLGAYNNFQGASNFHSSGIVATFNQGATLVSFDDTDDDGTLKALFAFDENDNLIGQSAFASQIPVVVDVSQTGGQLIYKVEFDTAPGTAGGSLDGTYFTIDNFHAEGVDPNTEVPIDPPDDICVGVTCDNPDGPCESATGTCNPATGQCEYTPLAVGTPCTDLNPCTVGTQCTAGGTCGALTPEICIDGIPCTTDSCDAELGCLHDPSDAMCVATTCTTSGDLNLSGTTNIADAVCGLLVALAEASGSALPSCLASNTESADLDCDGSLDIADAQIVVQIVLTGAPDSAIDANSNLCVDTCEQSLCGNGLCDGSEDCDICELDCGMCL